MKSLQCNDKEPLVYSAVLYLYIFVMAFNPGVAI